MKESSYLPAVIFLAIASYLSFEIFLQFQSPDLMAAWLAGMFYAAGTFEQIYPTDIEAFRMLVPLDWLTHLQATGYDGDVYPYIYPPLWADLMATLTRMTTFTTFKAIACIVNPVLLGGMLLLAHRTVNSTWSPMMYLLVGMALLIGTNIGAVALAQNQLQIFVSFLIVLAIERTRSGAPRVGGAALGLAAAIKLYPLLLVPIWLATGERRASVWFVLTGGSLGLLSVLLAGWPLHELFLAQISAIGRTVMITPFTISIESSLAQVFFSDSLQIVHPIDVTTGQPKADGWFILQKPPTWSFFSVGAMMGAIAALCLIARRIPKSDALVWPLAISVIALLGSLSWVYYFIPVVAFAPVLIDRFGYLRGGGGLLVALFPLFLPTLQAIAKLSSPVFSLNQLLGTLGGVLLASLFALALRPRVTAPPE